MKGNLDLRILCIKSNFIHYFLEMASVDIEKYIDTSIPPLLTLLELGTLNPKFSYVWQMFDESDGYSVINDLKASTIPSVSQKIFYLETTIDNMRNSLCK